MRPDTKQHLHFGVNFLTAPAPAVSTAKQLEFQQYLADPVRGIVFDTAQRQDTAFVFQRVSPPLDVRVGLLPTGVPQVGQLLITAPQPDGTIEEFLDDAQAVVEAYRAVFCPGALQVLRRDCTVRHLYAVREEHALLYLWERRLHQEGGSIDLLGRPVLGGGMRFVMPARPDVPDDPIVEVKIESLLADPRQLFVEASFVWAQPQAGIELDPRALVGTTEEYLNGEVTRFLLSE